MNMLYKAIQSRTVWTIAVMFVIGGVQALESVMSPETFVVVQGALSLLAAYFRVNPRV